MLGFEKFEPFLELLLIHRLRSPLWIAIRPTILRGFSQPSHEIRAGSDELALPILLAFTQDYRFT